MIFFLILINLVQWQVLIANLQYVYNKPNFDSSHITIKKNYDHGFRYDEQENWGQTCIIGRFQSPVNLITRNQTMSQFSIKLDQNYFHQQEVTLKNNGNTVEAEFEGSSSRKPSLTVTDSSSSNRVRKYALSQLHFHWGRNDAEGSEHALNWKTFPLEMHLIHFNQAFKTFEQARGQKNGILVMAVFFTTSFHHNSDLDFVINNLRRFVSSQMPSIKTSIKNVSFLLPLHSRVSSVLTYTGSLTTPPCTEQVTWVILEKPSLIGSNQLNKLRSSIEDEEGRILEFNFRKTQPLNGRQIGNALLRH